MLKNTYYVYIYFDPSKNNEPIYVGKGTKNRFKHHLSRTDQHPLTIRLKEMSDKGVDPIIEKYDNLIEQDALDLERELINTIGRKDLGTGPLLNILNGGGGFTGFVVTDEYRAKLSAMRKGHIVTAETRAKIGKANKGNKSRTGMKSTKEHCEKISKARKGIVFSDETKKKMSEAGKNKKPLTCPHCSKFGNPGGIGKYHFYNCKNIGVCLMMYKNWPANKKIPKGMEIVFGYVVPEEIAVCFPQDDELIKMMAGWVYYVEDMSYNVFQHIWRYD